MSTERILFEGYKSKITTAEAAAKLIKHGSVLGVSGFTKAGDSKAVLPALAKRAETEEVRVSLLSGASLGYDTETQLALNNVIAKRIPFMADAELRKSINTHKALYMDQHLSETHEMLSNKHFPKVNTALIEASSIDANGNIIPTTSVGNSATFAALADEIIIEVNSAFPLEFAGMHDIYLPTAYPNREAVNVTHVDTRIGTNYIKVDPSKVVAVVLTNKPDAPAVIAEPDEVTSAISRHITAFFNKEVAEGRLTKSLMPLQAGIGKIANAVLSGFVHSDFEDLVMYSEVLQDSTFELFDSGKMTFASTTSITISQDCYDNFINNYADYKDKIVLRPQNVSNLPEVIRRLGIIGINTAIEFDIYGNVNSTHIGGTRMMNGIGGSGDFARNAYISIFVCPSVGKGGTISQVVPMVAHTDHTEHDVDVVVTEQGLADLRGLAPTERAQRIIDNCVHPDYKAQMQAYYDEAYKHGGQTPHILEKAFSWHVNLRDHGTMKLSDSVY